MVAYECAQNTRTELADELRECAAPIQECAMAYVLGLDTVDYVLTGMRKPAYVAEFTGIR
jgi:hypothetical protein